MVTRVNGGYLNGQFLTGSLRHFAIEGPDFSAAIAGAGGVTVAGRDYDEGQPIPGSAAEEVYRVLAMRCTPVIMYIDDAGGLHVALENTSAAWLDVLNPAVGGNQDGVPASSTVATDSSQVLLTELAKLGASAGFDNQDLTTGVTITEVPYVLATGGNDDINSATN